MKKLIAVLIVVCGLWAISRAGARAVPPIPSCDGGAGIEAIVVNGQELRGKVELRFWSNDYYVNTYQDEKTGVWVINVIPPEPKRN